jgi:hypothetical protein
LSLEALLVRASVQPGPTCDQGIFEAARSGPAGAIGGIDPLEASMAGAPSRGQVGNVGGLVSSVAGSVPVVVSTVAGWRRVLFQTVVTVARAGLEAPALASG